MQNVVGKTGKQSRDPIMESTIEIGLKESLPNLNLFSFPKWTNHDNAIFYENISFEMLKDFATLAGLDTHADLQIIKPYLEKATSILEVGAGYGRVIEYLVKHKFSAKISTIERCQRFCSLLEKKFGEKIQLFNEDLQNFQTKEKYDVILWLWEGIAEFSHEEQKLILVKLISYLKANGILIIDTLSPELITLNSNYTEGEFNKVKAGNLFMYIYQITMKDIQVMLNNLLLKIKVHTYQTTTQRVRNLYVISH